MEKRNNDVITTYASIDRNGITVKEQLHIDLFTMSLYTGGLTTFELASLMNEEICDDYLVVERFESGLIAYIPMSAMITDIIARHKGACCKPYLLPIFEESHRTHEARLRRADEMMVEVNATLRRLSSQVGIEGDISIASTKRLFIESMIEEFVPFDEIAHLASCTEEEVGMHCKLMFEGSI